LANQRSHIGRMATIALIVIGVISLLVKRNKLTREVFYWLAAGREHSMFFFPPKKPEMSGAVSAPETQFSIFGLSLSYFLL
jgi:hypothetical protein